MDGLSLHAAADDPATARRLLLPRERVMWGHHEREFGVVQGLVSGRGR